MIAAASSSGRTDEFGLPLDRASGQPTPPGALVAASITEAAVKVCFDPAF